MKAYGFYPNDDGSWTVVFPSQETKSKTRSMTVPVEAVCIIQKYYCPEPTAAVNSKREAILSVLRKRDGISFGSAISMALEAMKEDTEDMTERRHMAGAINELCDSGILRREMKENGARQVEVVYLNRGDAAA